MSIVLNILIHNIPIKYYIFLFKSKKINSRQLYEKPESIRIVKRTIKRISALFPVDQSCLLKAFIFNLLCKSIGIENKIIFSILRNNSSELKAHAYINISSTGEYLRNINYRDVLVLE